MHITVSITELTKGLPVCKSLQKVPQYPKALKERANIQKARKGQVVFTGLQRASKDPKG